MKLNEIQVNGFYKTFVQAKLRDNRLEEIELIARVSGKTSEELVEVQFPPIAVVYYMNPSDLYPIG